MKMDTFVPTNLYVEMTQRAERAEALVAAYREQLEAWQKTAFENLQCAERAEAELAKANSEVKRLRDCIERIADAPNAALNYDPIKDAQFVMRDWKDKGGAG